MSRIPPETIELIIESNNIVDIIGEFVELKKAGVNYKGFSPWTDEKTPSFIISPAKNIFKDFSSGNAGNVISFLMLSRQMEFMEAINYLADKANITIEQYKDDRWIIQQQIKDKSTEYFQSNLKAFDQAYNYIRERGITDESIKKFKLGYNPTQQETKRTLKDFLLAHEFSIEQIAQTGVLKTKKENKGSKSQRDYFDTFNGRIIFPVQNLSNHIVGFGARITPWEESRKEKLDQFIAKYLNSDEKTPFGSTQYNKRSIVYGLNQIKHKIKQQPVHLVEGYTDAILLQQAEILAAASTGTAFTKEQAKQIGKFTQEIYVTKDGDRAGIKSAIRDAETIYSENRYPSFILLPEKTDPADIVVKAKNAKEAQKTFYSFPVLDPIEFTIASEKELVKINHPEKSSQIMNSVKFKYNTLTKIMDQYFKWTPEESRILTYVEEIADQLGFKSPATVIQNYYEHLKKEKQKQSTIPKQNIVQTNSRYANILKNIHSKPEFNFSQANQLFAKLIINDWSFVQHLTKEFPPELDLFNETERKIYKTIIHESKTNDFGLNLHQTQSLENQLNLFDKIDKDKPKKQDITKLNEFFQNALLEKQIDTFPYELLDLLRQGVTKKIEPITNIMTQEIKFTNLKKLYNNLHTFQEMKNEFETKKCLEHIKTLTHEIYLNNEE